VSPQVRVYDEAWYVKHGKDWFPTAGERQKNRSLKAQHGIGLRTYRKLLAEQSGKCAICRQVETARLKGKIRDLAVDHNHETGRIRGLLCFRCNVLLGQAEDNVELLQEAIAYLEDDDGREKEAENEE
jgi:hypothetical protein